MIGKGKRPRDPNQLAASTAAVSTGQIPAPEPEIPKPVASAAPQSISEYMSTIGRKSGQIGGKHSVPRSLQKRLRAVGRKPDSPYLSLRMVESRQLHCC